jgi:hypothetical protein
MPRLRSSFSTLAAGLVGAVCVLIPGSAHADKKATVIALPMLEITGRVSKPLVTVEIGRIAPIMPLSELRPPFAEKIAEATRSGPF